MEPREVQSPAGGLQVQQQQQQQQSQHMLMGQASSSYPSNPALINSNPTANVPPPFPFNSLSSPVPLQRHQQQNQNQHQQDQHQQHPKPFDSMNSAGFDELPQFRYNTEPALKKKRGRPRKYAPDGNIALLQLAPTPQIASNSANHGEGESVGLGSNSGVGAVSEPPAKKNRGRPPGSTKKQMDALGGVGGVGFTPHVITVEAGEDVASKIMAFSQQGPRTVCILSANGAISNVTLRQPEMSGGTVTYEGRFEIISLSGSFLLSENSGGRSRSGGLSVSLAGSDGRVLGGGVAGMLRAASPVQVIVGSFIADGKKQSSDAFRTGPSSVLASNMLNFRAPGMTGSPPSQGGSSESSDENGGSPLNRGSDFYTSSAPSIHNNNVQMYQLWTDHSQQ
ncbi:AT-hook motif nuclear-localized protein 13 [Hibiscus syriacus]|uniref:AT-hook motif nuclear-localized protein n=1 Tax=Hibiscus syriacus TaxID=106335 RepID=A0A6A2Y663_HIBSY|nr:AT-hook motif nuclear-localized protein 13-like [Hibiscus syriacus]XP_039036356.1 AT-hook motif nuclear-localized protein 13-like [Hibiscus syriacus]XP_039036357.1 AT-hook motif nuclear-localized protein 13-like [Hibiscus syriacus]KAE8671706.1 AT-hook motif nuclear-localized protein 13 [Hibiscus syriacus]